MYILRIHCSVLFRCGLQLANFMWKNTEGYGYTCKTHINPPTNNPLKLKVKLQQQISQHTNASVYSWIWYTYNLVLVSRIWRAWFVTGTWCFYFVFAFCFPVNMVSTFVYSLINPYGAETGIFRVKINTMSVDCLASCVTRPPTAMALVPQHKRSLVFHEEGSQRPAPSVLRNDWKGKHVLWFPK